MGLSWQQGPPATGATGRLLVPGPLSGGVLPARRRRGPCPVGDRAHDAAPQPRAGIDIRWTTRQVHLDDVRLRLEPGQTVVAHGVDRNLAS